MSSLQLFDALPAHIEAALRDSIEEFGVLVPVFVSQHGEIIDGHHRSRIAREVGVGFETVVLDVDDEEHALRLAYTLNSDRRQLSTEDRVAAAARLRQRGHSYRAIGEALGVSEGAVRKDVAAEELRTGTQLSPDRVVGIDGKSRPAKVTERESRSTTVDTPAAADPARQAQIDEQHYQRLTDLAPDLADRVNDGTVELREAVAELDQRQADEDGAIRRRAVRLQHLVDGWLEVPGLADLPERDQVLALLNDHDRDQVLAIEAIYHKADA